MTENWCLIAFQLEISPVLLSKGILKDVMNIYCILKIFWFKVVYCKEHPRKEKLSRAQQYQLAYNPSWQVVLDAGQMEILLSCFYYTMWWLGKVEKLAVIMPCILR